MNNKIWVGIGVVALVIVGILVNAIGGVTIRSNDTSLSRIAIQVPGSLSAGSHATLRWDTPSSVASQQVAITIRSKQGSEVVNTVPFFAGTATIEIPCAIPQGPASIELVSIQNQSLIAWKTINIAGTASGCEK